ncbi:venom protease [Calliphora vicina]|uniref:venom protease n=1 Tax=Calliphora vicina TaxID=7373 RepID=UPI00325C08E4
MLHLEQTVCILIISCICLTLALNEHDGNILPGKYHAYSQQLPKKVPAKGLDLHQHRLHQIKLAASQPSGRQENPIKTWFGVFNRNNSKPQSNTTTNGVNANNNAGAAAAQDTLYSTTCSCRCGERNDESRIVGGTTTGVSEYPWMARLSYFNRFYCGGTLINDRYVLTAAHCVKGFMWFMIKVTFGEHDRCNDKERPETRFVLRAFTQKFSFSNFDNDIALLRLNDRVPITSFIRPICLPRAEERNDLFVGTKGIATGWGTLKEDGKPSCLLQEVEVPVLDNETCVAQTNYTQKMITKNMMCAGYPGKGERDSCQGDSGGPLVRLRPDDKRYEQIGIVSWGNGCARPNYPGVYTRVTKYLDWIVENSKDGCFCDGDF